MLRIWHASRLPCQRTGLLDRHGAAPVTQTIMRRRGCILKLDLGHLNNTKRIQGIGVDHGTTRIQVKHVNSSQTQTMLKSSAENAEKNLALLRKCTYRCRHYGAK